jgi:tRNA (cmo5U34)-methyltransferase
MKVARHLGIDLAQYDERIRTFIPHYEEMLDAVAAAIPVHTRTILDIGIGTGALTERCVSVAPNAHIIGIDRDPSMLEMARRRLANRAELLLGRLETAAYPQSDAVVASLALHHVRTEPAKTALYQRLFGVVRPGGVFVNADCFPATDVALRAAQRRAWRSHLQSTYTPSEAAAYFRSWHKQDVYMSLNLELRMLRVAGFEVELWWRRGMFGVLVGRRRNRSLLSPE